MATARQHPRRRPKLGTLVNMRRRFSYRQVRRWFLLGLKRFYDPMPLTIDGHAYRTRTRRRTR